MFVSATLYAMRFFTTTPKPAPVVAANQNGLRKATKPIAPTDIHIRRSDSMPKGLNRTDLISLEQARTRPGLIYGGFVDRKVDVIISDESPLDNLVRWASQQCKSTSSGNNRVSPLRAADIGLAPFTAFMDDMEDFNNDGSFYQGHNDSDDSFESAPPKTPAPVCTDAAPICLPGTITATLIPLDMARSRNDIRYRPEAFETKRIVL